MRLFGNQRVVLDTVIGAGTHFEGELLVHEAVRIDGQFKGKIVCEGSVILGEGGRVEGEISGESVLIAGEVQGEIVARNHLQITGHGKVCGAITTPSLAIDQGVVFEGRCHMAPPADVPKTEPVPIRLASSKGAGG
jgi:cytoskeletal protein CcmA (bactofilin family)